MMAQDELLTVAQVADRLHAHPETIRQWLKAGRLRGILPGGKRLGWRIRESDLEQFFVERGQGRGAREEAD